MRQSFYATTMIASRSAFGGEAPHVRLVRLFARRLDWLARAARSPAARGFASRLRRHRTPSWIAVLALALVIGWSLNTQTKGAAPIPPATERLAGAIDRAAAALETIQILGSVAEADDATTILIESGFEAERIAYDLQRAAGRKASCQVDAAIKTAQMVTQLNLELARASGALGPDFAAHARIFREESRRLLSACERRG